MYSEKYILQRSGVLQVLNETVKNNLTFAFQRWTINIETYAKKKLSSLQIK